MRTIVASLLLAALASRVTDAPEVAPSELRDLVDRYETDRAALLRRYPVERSPQRRTRLEAFYGDWKRQVGAVDFGGLGLEGRVDHILLRNELAAGVRTAVASARAGVAVRGAPASHGAPPRAACRGEDGPRLAGCTGR